MGMTEPYPQTPTGGAAVVKKDKTWIWVIVLFLVLCLCLCILAGGVGLYLYFDRPAEVLPVWTAPEEEVPAPPEPPAIPEPTARPEPTLVPLPLPETVIIEPFIPGSEYVISLTELVTGFEGSSQPGDLTWEVLIGSTQPVMIQQGWCTATEAILEENFLHIEISFEADGEMVDTDNMYLYDYTSEDMFCRAYLGIIRAWPIGDHVIISIMRFDAPLNDGWGDYPAGRYLDLFLITVIP
jgi:hypothetical protein